MDIPRPPTSSLTTLTYLFWLDTTSGVFSSGVGYEATKLPPSGPWAPPSGPPGTEDACWGSVSWLSFSAHTFYCICRGIINCAIINCVAFFQIPQTSTFYSILYLILRFTNEEAEVRKQAFPFVPARYIRTFDAISEVNCVVLRRKRRFEKIALYPNFDVISEVNCVSPRRK